MVTGIIFIGVFSLTLIFGIIRIIKAAPHRTVTSTSAASVLTNNDESTNIIRSQSSSDGTNNSDIYAVSEDITKLVIELIFTLFAILATFALMRYIKGKYAAVPTQAR